VAQLTVGLRGCSAQLEARAVAHRSKVVVPKFSLLARIRLDQAHSGLRVISQAAIGRLEAAARSEAAAQRRRAQRPLLALLRGEAA
jgi:hypothetical protein